MKTDQQLNMDNELTPELARIDDSLILALFERSRFKANKVIYELHRIGSDQGPYLGSAETQFDPSKNQVVSFLDFILAGTEELHARAGRYIHPEEHAFTKYLPKPIIRLRYGSNPLKGPGVNLNNIVKQTYLAELANFCQEGDDSHYGSTAVCDVRCLQELSRRVHFGSYTAESKFQSNPESFSRAIASLDIRLIQQMLTIDTSVEQTVLKRVVEKGERYQLNPVFITEFYKDKIIPLTKQVEVDYLLRRGCK